MQTVETEIVKAHTRLDGVDARLKRLENKMDNITWIVAGLSFAAPFVATYVLGSM